MQLKFDYSCCLQQERQECNVTSFFTAIHSREVLRPYRTSKVEPFSQNG